MLRDLAASGLLPGLALLRVEVRDRGARLSDGDLEHDLGLLTEARAHRAGQQLLCGGLGGLREQKGRLLVRERYAFGAHLEDLSVRQHRGERRTPLTDDIEDAAPRGDLLRARRVCGWRRRGPSGRRRSSRGYGTARGAIVTRAVIRPWHH